MGPSDCFMMSVVAVISSQLTLYSPRIHRAHEHTREDLQQAQQQQQHNAGQAHTREGLEQQQAQQQVHNIGQAHTWKDLEQQQRQQQVHNIGHAHTHDDLALRPNEHEDTRDPKQQHRKKNQA